MCGLTPFMLSAAAALIDEDFSVDGASDLRFNNDPVFNAWRYDPGLYEGTLADDAENILDVDKDFLCRLPEYWGEDTLLDGTIFDEDVADEVLEYYLTEGRVCSRSVNIIERRNALLTKLQERFVCRRDLPDLYNAGQQNAFNGDILELMRSGYDIRRRGGEFRCLGKIGLDTCRPKRHIAAAMFDALKDGWFNKFDVFYTLLFQGYRKEPSGFFASLEAAFVVADVHPGRTRVQRSGGADITDPLKTLWAEVRVLSESAFLERLLKKSVYSRKILYHLYMLQKTNMLDVLVSMKEKFVQSGGYCVQRQGRLKNRAYEILVAQKNRPIFIADLLNDVNFSFHRQDGKRQSICVFRDVVLDLSFDGVPLVYDREKETMMIVSPAPKAQPPEGINFLIAVYDCLCQRKRGLGMNVREIAYHVHTQGFWSAAKCIDYREKERLQNTILQIKRFLAILGCINVESCGRCDQQELARMRHLWSHLRNKEGFQKDLSYYQEKVDCAVSQEDLRRLSQVQVFVDSPEYAQLLAHMVARDKKDHELTLEEQYLKDFLSDGSLTEEGLWKKCRAVGLKPKKNIWPILKSLTERRGPGRVVFDFAAGGLVWDARSCFEERESVFMPAELFCVQNRWKGLSLDMRIFVMQQCGFKDINKQKVQRAVIGFEVLGLVDAGPEVKNIAIERSFFNALLCDVHSKELCTGTLTPWRVYGIKQMVAWLPLGSMEKLWKTYLSQRFSKEGEPPRKKRKMVVKKGLSPEQIISEEIPALKAFLIEKNIWLAEGS